MLYPAMSDLLLKIDNRYKLVNITAKRARDIALGAEHSGEKLSRKSVSIALDEILDGKIEVEEDSQE